MVVFSIILLSSLVGNALIVTIVYKRQELRKTINYFIVNMAISDFAFPLTVLPEGLVATATGSWEWPIAGTAGLIACKLKNFLQRVSVAVSTGSLVWIALERFVAVVLPMKTPSYLTQNARLCYRFHVVRGRGSKLFRFVRVRIGGISSRAFLHRRLQHCLFEYNLFQAVTLRRQDKALQCRAVHQKDQRKRRAIKMAVCVMAAFYICNLPLLIAYIVFESGITVSCLAWFLTYVLFYLSSAINPIICMAFVQSYRRGLREIFDPCCSKLMTTYSMETTSEPEQITLQEIREIGMNENLAFSET
ncbi:Galanin receptor type 1 [Desmophyllum pertusum]|uniref:Galanin receptor type 1 n=1 Tax=Desmophyllum pertusum TaxID=174260 RepID=A0A9X0CWL6_9CNID|nr:Galanin receptor type 1 [Desmophyllum pertusum]